MDLVCSLVILTVVTAVQAESEPRVWTPPYGWPTSVTGKTTVRMPFSSPETVCDGVCCKCNTNKTQIECIATTSCKEFIMGIRNATRFPPQAKYISLKKFRMLKIYKESLVGLDRLVNFEINGVDAVEIEAYALSRPLCNNFSSLRISSRPTITISFSSLNYLTARSITDWFYDLVHISGAWDEITIINSRLSLMQTESFYNTNCLKKLTIQNNLITVIEGKTLYNGSAQYVEIKNNTIGIMKNQAFIINQIDHLNMTSNRVNDLQSQVFTLKTVQTFHFRNNTIGTIYPHAFQLFVSEEIIISFNSFEKVARHAFEKIRMANATKMRLAFSLKKFEKGFLDLSDSLSTSVVLLIDVRLDLKCECDLDKQLETTTNLARVSNVISDSVSCNAVNGTENVRRFTRTKMCNQTSSIVIGSVVSVLVLSVICLGIGIAICYRTKLRRTGVKTQNSIVMRVYTEAECKIDEEYALPLEVVNEYV